MAMVMRDVVECGSGGPEAGEMEELEEPCFSAGEVVWGWDGQLW